MVPLLFDLGRSPCLLQEEWRSLMLFLEGMIVGFLIAAPVGPVGIMCIRLALNDGRAAAFVAGLGAAVADTFYGAVAGFGLSLVSGFLMEYREALSLVGGSVLLVLGIRTWRQPPPELRAESGLHPGLWRDFTATLLLTLTNPATILAFMAVFASLGSVRAGESPARAFTLVAGVFAGSALWWFTLSALAGAVRHRFSPVWLTRLNLCAGGLLFLSGVAALLSLFYLG